MNSKFQYFDNRRFTRDDKTGYYLCATASPDGKRRRMHVYVWEYYNGPVPKGYHVHHKDRDKSNNDISNLELMDEFEHESLHGKEYAEEHYDEMIANLNENARPKASEWHGSNKGREWHKKHYEKMKDKLYVQVEYKCDQCGKEFLSTKVGSRFCSNNCRSAWRRASGADNVVKKCEYCGGEYIANKYQKTKYCSVCRYIKHKGMRTSGCLQHGS